MSEASNPAPDLKVHSKSAWWRTSAKGQIKNAPGTPRRLAISSVGALFVYAGGAGLSYISQLLIARTIGADSFGIYSYVWAWVTVLAYFSTLGFHVSLLRFVPAYRAKEQWALVQGVIQYSQRGTAALGLLVMLVGAGFILALYDSMRPELAVTFIIGIVTIPIISQHQICSSLVRAFGGIVKAIAPERVVRDGVLLIIVGIVAWSGLFKLDAEMAMSAALISAVTTLALLKYFFRELRPIELEGISAAVATKEWLRPAIPIMFIVAADGLMSRSGVIALGISGNTLDAGVFAVALSISLITALPRMAVSAAFAPNVSDLFARADHAGLRALSARASVLSLAGSLCVATPLLFFNTPLLGLFGDSFAVGAPIVTILVFGQLFAAACGPQQHIITMTGNERSAAAIMMVCAIGNLIACILVIGEYGAIGGAVAMTATLVFWNAAMAAYIHHRLDLAPGLILAVGLFVKRG